jgi:hypothetical protein
MKFILAILTVGATVTQALTVTSTATIKGRSTQELQTFLATPTNWPSIVASSFGAEQADAISPKSKINAIDRPLKKGERVKEVFGLPPVLPLYVTWTCQQNTVKKAKKGMPSGGNLEFFSAEGLGGVAENCRMSFDITSAGVDGQDTTVDMTVEVVPVSFLGNLAGPVLKVDNDLALKVLLPLALKR